MGKQNREVLKIKTSRWQGKKVSKSKKCPFPASIVSQIFHYQHICETGFPFSLIISIMSDSHIGINIGTA